MSGKNEEYVVRGATMECSAGNQRAYFYPTSARGTSVGTGTQGIDTDRNPENVVVDFGTCGNIDGESNRCTKSFQWIWQNASTKAFYSAYTKLSHSFRKLYEMYVSLMEEHGDGIQREMTIHDMPMHTTEEGLYLKYAPQYSTLDEYRNAMAKIERDLSQLGLSEEDAGYKKAQKQSDNMAQLLENIDLEIKYEGQVGRGRLLLDSSVLHCKNDGIISFVENSGQILYANISPYHESILELRRKVREAITAHYAGQDNAADQAARTIERLNMNDDASANRHYNGKWTSHDPESNPYKLLAWIVLLENDSAEKRRKLEEFQEQAENDELSGVAIFEWDEWQFDDDVFENRYISQIKKDAHKLYPEAPMKADDSSTLGEIGLSEGVDRGGYPGHRGIDLRTAHATGKIIYSTKSGNVSYTGYRRYPGDSGPYNENGVKIAGTGGYGNYVKLIDNLNRTHIYAHFTNSATDIVSVGNFILQGKQIGISGNTGNSTGAHLHYEVQPSGACESSANCLDPRLKVNEVLPDITFGTQGRTSFIRENDAVDTNKNDAVKVLLEG